MDFIGGDIKAVKWAKKLATLRAADANGNVCRTLKGLLVSMSSK